MYIYIYVYTCIYVCIYIYYMGGDLERVFGTLHAWLPQRNWPSPLKTSFCVRQRRPI